MNRKLLILILTLTVLFACTLPASADIPWEPYENDYYNSTGYENFDYMDRTYYVPEGMTANVYKNPETGGLIKTLEAGTRIYIGPYAKINGETWAAGYAYGEWENEGWVRLDRLQLEYDHEAFEADFGNQFITTDDVLTRDDVDGDIQTWTYPGSGVGDGIVPADALGGGYNDGVMDFRYVYTDPDGGRWGYVGYYMGRCGWVWLDDPTNPEPPVQIHPDFPSTVTDTSPEEAPGNGSMEWIAILVAILVLATAVAIVLLKKKKRA